MTHRDEQIEIDLLRQVVRKLDHIEEELEELEAPPAPATYPRTAAITVV